MKKKAIQTINGKAFEYALLDAFNARLGCVTCVSIVDNMAFRTAIKCFNELDDTERAKHRLTASFAVNFLIDIEPRLSWGISDDDILELEIVSDKEGQLGDVRDVLAIRSLQKWEIGISAKNNHRAVKHPRLSADIDFGDKWLSLPCSSVYFEKVGVVFSHLTRVRKESMGTAVWDSLGDYHKIVYKPILDAFVEELLRLDREYPKIVAPRLIEYLIGNKDFYKVIKLKNEVEIQAYNIHGTLCHPLKSHRPKAVIPRLKLPTRIIDIGYAKDSQTTLDVIMDEGWQMSFRIHNASSRVEPSLKFDVNLVSSPHTLFVNKLFLSKQ